MYTNIGAHVIIRADFAARNFSMGKAEKEAIPVVL